MRFIAEVATNHGGSVEKAFEMIREASEAGADTIKFQHVYPEYFENGGQRDWYHRVRFDLEQWRRIIKACEQMNIKFLCTPQTVGDFEDLMKLGIEEVKVSSDNLENSSLLEAVVNSGIPAIVSLNGWDEFVIDRALTIIQHSAKTLMICTSKYPCSLKEARLDRLKKTDQISYGNVYIFEPDHWGFSDHTIGSMAAVMAVALGATVFEKHFMLEGAEGPDAGPWCCTPAELKQYFDDIKTAEKML